MLRLFPCLLILLFSGYVQSTTLLVLGDSLSAGYQMPIEKAWPSLLPEALQQRDKQVTVINGSISGDTTGNGLARLPALLSEHQPDVVLIELGANDGLRGFPPTLIEKNLNQLIDQIQGQQSKAILMQIHVLPNYGKRYTQAFSALFPNVASSRNIPLVPFFLEGVIARPEWMMEDGLHPRPEAQPWIAEFVAQQIADHL
ncbi:arylesterase [Vibrio sp.]|uniref:arylesterase n=1 Tax=Vibrio sp. TaxID=678 RepID=UPI003D0D1F12